MMEAYKKLNRFATLHSSILDEGSKSANPNMILHKHSPL